MKPYIVVVALATLVPNAMAQERSTPAQPGDPALSVPPVRYESAFARYVSYREEKLAPWREVNDEVGKIRGHAGIFGRTGHTGHGAGEKAGPAKPPAGKPVAGKPAEPAGQPPARGAPNAPAGAHQGH